MAIRENKGVVLWATVAGLDLIGIVWSQTLLENYAMVNYIERYLLSVAEERDWFGYVLGLRTLSGDA